VSGRGVVCLERPLCGRTPKGGGEVSLPRLRREPWKIKGRPHRLGISSRVCEGEEDREREKRFFVLKVGIVGSVV